jgi:hypothetical protein
MSMDRYRVEIRVELIKTDERGSYSNERMTFTDQTDLGKLNIQQIAELLTRFHDLSVNAKNELI